MPINVNGTSLSKVKVGSTWVNKVVCNGTVVFVKDAVLNVNGSLNLSFKDTNYYGDKIYDPEMYSTSFSRGSIYFQKTSGSSPLAVGTKVRHGGKVYHGDTYSIGYDGSMTGGRINYCYWDEEIYEEQWVNGYPMDEDPPAFPSEGDQYDTYQWTSYIGEGMYQTDVHRHTYTGCISSIRRVTSSSLSPSSKTMDIGGNTDSVTVAVTYNVKAELY